MSSGRATPLLLFAALGACTSRPQSVTGARAAVSSGGATSARTSTETQTPTQTPSTSAGSQLSPSLVAMRDALLRAEPAALRALSIELGRGGATEISGDRAEDERVAAVEVPVFDARAAMIVLRTSCGNIRLVGLVREGDAWRPRQSYALVPTVRPGSCVRVSLVAQPLALRSDPARDAALGVRWEDAMGDEVHGPHLWIAGLDDAQGATLLLERAPFGGTDDRTGATTVGSVAVIDELPAPRPLFVEIRPGTRGAGGAGPNQRTVRRYELRGARMELVDEQQSTLGQ